MTPVSNHFGSSCAGALSHGVCTAGWYGGADFSIPSGVLVAALLYWLAEKATGYVRSQVAGEKQLEASH